MFDHPDWLAHAKAIHAAPGDDLPKQIAADWLLEHGATEAQAAEVVISPHWSNVLPVTYYGSGSGLGSGLGSGRGRGLGSGSGSGRGSGSGSGGRGRGLGSGSGRGRGSGSGRGGSGRGRGLGSGSGRGRGSGRKEIHMKPGKNYLILTVEWYAWVGQCIRQVNPYEYEFKHVSKFDTNQGDVFGEVAADKPGFRDRCTFQHFEDDPETPNILGMGAVGKFAWKGKLPWKPL